MDKRTYTLEVTMEKAEVRKVERIKNTFEKDGKDIVSEYLDLSIDDENGNRVYLKDKNLDNESKYHRGDVGTFHITIQCEEDFKKKYTILVRDFVKTE